jgi:hypothetical protein
MLDRLERITADAHQVIYQDRELGLARIRTLIARGFPGAVRSHARYVAVSALTFVVPTIVIASLVYWQPDLILSVVDSDTASSFDQMYSPGTQAIGRLRDASTDWIMFGITFATTSASRSSVLPAACSPGSARCSFSPTTARFPEPLRAI